MAIDITISHYSDGTATVAGVNVTGQGTTWSLLRPGDQYGTHRGFGVRIAEVIDDTHLTLAYDVPALYQTEADYEIQRTPYELGYMQGIQDLLLKLGNGNLDSFAGLNGLADKLPMFTGPGELALVSKIDLVSGVNFNVQVDDLAGRAAYDNEATGFAVLVANVGDGRSAIYAKRSGAAADWSDPAYLTGPAVTLEVTEVDEVPYGSPPDVVLTPVAGGYNLAFEIPRGMMIEPGTTTTLPPGSDAIVDFVPVTGGYRLDISLPKGDTGDIDGVTPFWITRITTDVDASAALTGLGFTAFSKALIGDADSTAARTTLGAVGAPGSATNNHIAVFDTDGNLLKDGGKTIDELVPGDNSITNAILANMATATFKARATAGTGDPEDLTAEQARVVLGLEYGFPLLHVRDAKAVGVGGGTNVAGANIRVLNTVITNDFGATLSSNRVTLPAGTYFLEASAPGHGVARHQVYIVNVTAGVDVIFGVNEYSNNTALQQVNASISGRFTLASSSMIELRHYMQVVTADVGLGVPKSVTGYPEVYADMKIWKLK
ncbi:hypothetical protein [Devosia sp.]|uniref:hypothetical protein n=1 Tax=Devosia sp. TaxID=1871048 RepID=UPI001B07B155|nr:hypothetical protein [Devosia sp.]MBO9589054.1 hypothetical protein [Devosia sp.]